MPPFRIVIVGGGIAGFTAAIALRGSNRQITVLEQSSLNKEIGALISLQPNASRIVESKWCLKKELRGARQMVDQGIRIYNTDGQLVKTVPLLTKTEYGANRLIFHRRDLHETLKEAAISPEGRGDPVLVRTASRVVDCNPEHGTVTLEDGGIVRGDLIIGADGIHSVLRKHVLYEDPLPMPTGHSAYRLMIPTQVLEEHEPYFCEKINPRDPFTSMMVAHNCRLIMGPGRQGEVFGIVALVPDDEMSEDPQAKQSWVSEGVLMKMLETFAEFPIWVTDIFKHSADIGLWQLRDLDPLKTWHRGRVILIGDAAHAMLPTQGQGASQAIEDSEALGAFFEDIDQPPSLDILEKILEDVFHTRYSRVSLIQAHSRQAAKPGTAKGDKTITIPRDALHGARHPEATGVPIVTRHTNAPIILSAIWIPRCQTKDIICVPRTTGTQHSNDLSRSQLGPLCSPLDRDYGELTTITTTPESGPSEFSVPRASAHYSGSSHDSKLGHYELGMNPFLSREGLQVHPALNSFPAFFEQVMQPSVEFDGVPQGTQQPRSVFDFMQDTDFTFSDSDLFGTDFIPDLDRIIDTRTPFSTLQHTQDPGLDADESARRRVEAFQRSLWLWVPEKNQNAFSEEGRIPLRDSDRIPPTHQTRLEALNIPGKLSVCARENILKLVIRTAGSRLSVSSFPSAEYLDTLIKIGIDKRTETDAWIHPYTFFDQQARPELLTALVAAGCVCCGLPSFNKTGIILQEITRVSLAQLVENDNSVLRDLQYMQASMLWLDIGIFCGYKRKMHIAESYLQPLCTALRRAAVFDRSTYSVITPYLVGDDEESLQKVWHEWVRQESLKRLVYHLFGHDIEVSLAMHRPAIISYTELTLPFPAARDLWLAPTAAAWKDIWTARYHAVKTTELSLRGLLSDPSLITHVTVEHDCEISRSALLHGLASQVWEFRQQMMLSQGHQPGPRATTQLWLQSRQEDLYTTLKTVQAESLNPPAVTTLLQEFIMMYLHVDVDAIQRFVGKLGELDARRAYPGLRDWSRTKGARTSIWHAGQVLRAARSVSAYQLRGFDSLAIYHSALVLWVYGLLQCGETRRLEMSTPMSETDRAPSVALDGPEYQATRAFLGHDHGRPGLTMYQHRNGQEGEAEVFCELSKPRSIMAVARQVFEGSCPRSLPNDILPPIIQNLCNLIEDLGNLP
ncbi:hypothetical protein N7474_005016 [Penicillium riverlandense]|uniref:uncharacterized protein n=1 Tax=Penicillium riverlandense TaxID=1903569 RepID=UPI0025477F56|nr:uncharacterized protein N7474_005016 [Penicillium riverlandense]KAJ5819425.1 hypothetical protein N7474_005016 [Penicillium riverlandense]